MMTMIVCISFLMPYFMFFALEFVCVWLRKKKKRHLFLRLALCCIEIWCHPHTMLRGRYHTFLHSRAPIYHGLRPDGQIGRFIMFLMGFSVWAGGPNVLITGRRWPFHVTHSDVNHYLDWLYSLLYFICFPTVYSSFYIIVTVILFQSYHVIFGVVLLNLFVSSKV